MGCGSLRAKRRRHQPPWRSVSETSARKLKLTVKKRSQSIYNFRIILLNILCYFTFQEPPLSGPSLSIIPSAFSFARCFSTAFAVTPISAARPAAVNLPFSERRAMIFSLLFPVFLLPFEVFPLLFTVFFLLFPLQNLHEILLHVDIDRAVAGEGAAAFDFVEWYKEWY